MSVRRILAKTIDTDLEYEAIGIDLAKNCVSAALLTTMVKWSASTGLTILSSRKVPRRLVLRRSPWSHALK